jgi:hypothetical protein
MNLSTRKIEELTLFVGNARRGDVPAIAESLAQNGQYKPVVVNVGTTTGRPDEVLVGNHTLLAARSLGWESIDVCYVDVIVRRWIDLTGCSAKRNGVTEEPTKVENNAS